MTSVESFREFINDRLTAAAEEIFRVFEQTVVQYEEEIDRQQRLLDSFLKPEIQLRKTEILQLPAYNEEAPLHQQMFYNQERNFSLNQTDPEAQQIKEEEGVLANRQKEGQRSLKQGADVFKLRHSCEGRDLRKDLHFECLESAAEKEPLTNISAVVMKSESDKEDSVEPNNEHHLSHNSHRDNSQSHSSVNQENVSTDQEGENKHLKCSFCTETFSDSLKLKIHISSHTGEKPFQCATCGKGFSKKAHLSQHVITHTGLKPFTCRVCGKEFNCSSNRDAHMKTHSDAKPHTCATCGRGFSRSGDLRRHNRIHTGEKPYSCYYCEQEFPYHTSLKNHLRIHTGEKPYKCMWCGKRFSLNSTLKIHTRIHTGEKPYECNVCGKTFAHNTRLNDHRKTHIQ